MTSSLRRIGTTVAFLGFASILPAAVRAQPPVYLTQWGSYGQGDGQFYFPTGVATDAAGNVYVTDASTRVQKFTSTGTFLTKWYSGDNGVCTDIAGDVYVTAGNGRIQKFTRTGFLLTQWGSLRSGRGEVNAPIGVAAQLPRDAYVTDPGHKRLPKINRAAAFPY